MSKTVKDPKTIFAEVISDYQRIYGDDLISIILYGSAATDDYLPGKSDINLMIVLSEKGIEQLDRAFAVIQKWRKKKVSIPLFVTEAYVSTSLDVFPIEYLNFQRRHHLVFGKNILEDLEVDPQFIRLQCEREIKGKLLLLREAFLEASGKGRMLRQLVKHSIPALAAIFEALLHLKGMDVPKPRQEVFEKTCNAYQMDTRLFDQLLAIKQDRLKPANKEMNTIFLNYLTEISKLAKDVDALGG